MSNPSIPDYEIVEKLGTGSYSNVYKAYKKGNPKELVAIKCVLKSNMKGSAGDNIITEISLLKKLKHEHIVEMKDFQWDDNFIYIIMEYCKGGDLSTFIKRRKALPEKTCRVFLQQLALALRYLRSSDICHLDLKPQNLLLSGAPTMILKVADFGFAAHMPLDMENTTMRGSPLYMAPEVLLVGRYDARADLWAVGVILYECLFGKAPYSSKSLADLVKKVQNQMPIELPANSCVSADCRNLLKRLLQPDPQNRITFEDFFAHPFLDLEHAPSKENYGIAVDLITRAINLDKNLDHGEALCLYSEALKYFVPIITAETDMLRKQALRLRVNEYIKRAEKIKQALKQQDKATLSEISPIQETSQQATKDEVEGVSAMSIYNALTPSTNFQRLKELSLTSPNINAALDQGRTGILYIAEGSNVNALDTLKGALSELVPLLGSEPKGERRDLLHSQIKQWMQEAESLKELLRIEQLKDGNEDIKDNCSLQ